MVAVFFLSSKSGFWSGLMIYAHFGVAVDGFCSFGVAVGNLHFHAFCHSKQLKIFYNVKNFTFENILHRNKWSVVVIACSFEVVTA